MKRKLIAGIFFVGLILLWVYFPFVQKFFQKSVLAPLRGGAITQQLQNIEKQIFAPPPLRGSQTGQGGQLSLAGVVEWTNINRAQNGNLPALKQNAELNKAAQLKLEDMFKQQYFEHENPQGKGPADLAKTVGYEYILIGENLALGNFKGDQDLVQAWMHSPGHRANILNNKFIEIGVAVGKGIYEGRQTWLAVQEFGKPASSCPSVDSNLKLQIDSIEEEIKQLEPQLEALKKELDESDPKTRKEYEEYNKKVAQYNAVVKIYNNKVDNLKNITEAYNAQVRAYNACASG